MVEFGVVASDLAIPRRRRRTSRAVVRVHVDDVDDESPTFLRSDYVFSVAENLATGATTISPVHCSFITLAASSGKHNVKPCLHQQRCRSNISLCRKNRSTCSIRQCCFDIVAGVDGV